MGGGSTRGPDEVMGTRAPRRPPGGRATTELAVRLQRGELDAPLPGSGATATRFAVLAALAAEDLALGRLAEGHLDAVAILAEAGREPVPGATYGVWAARSSAAEVHASVPTGPEGAGDGLLLQGAKEFCSGARGLDRALVTAAGPDGGLLVDLSLDAPGVQPVDGTWPSVGMSDSDSVTVDFETVAVDDAGVVGDVGYYLDRPGFWHGGVGVAACWMGGARALVDGTAAGLATRSPGDAELAALGTAVAAAASAQALLDRAAAEIDADPFDHKGQARSRALVVRHGVHIACSEVLRSVAAAGGARSLSLDPAMSRRAADLYVYLAQHHPGRDGAALGRQSIAEMRERT